MFFAKSNGKKRAEIYLYDAIGEGWSGGITAMAFAEAMKGIGNASALDIYINSPGGSVFDGIAIYNQIKRFSGEKIVHIDGIAASIASVIALAGDEIHIAANGTIMIHDPWGATAGTAEGMRKMADSLDLVRDTILDTYTARTGGKREELGAWMSEETWMSADVSMERGFATHKTESKTVQASFPLLGQYRNTPAPLRQQGLETRSLLARMDKRVVQSAARGLPR